MIKKKNNGGVKKGLFVLFLLPFFVFVGFLLFVVLAGVGLVEIDRQTRESGGNGGDRLVEMARTQLGVFPGVKYASWYGLEPSAAWCAAFVSWCANECGFLEGDILPRYAYCPSGIEWFEERGLFRSNTYIPKAGDIVFFDWDGDKVSDHTGIVADMAEGKVLTIEGNTGNPAGGVNCVAEKVRSLDKIIGFGAPLYPFDGGGLEGDEVSEQIYNFLRGHGYSHAAACGILGNTWQESKQNPSLIQGGGSGPAAGLCQWENYNTKSGRWKAMADYAGSRGRDWTDLESQLEYLCMELEGGEPTCAFLMRLNYGGIENFKCMNDVNLATEAFEKCFERAGVPNMAERLRMANEYSRVLGQGK